MGRFCFLLQRPQVFSLRHKGLESRENGAQAPVGTSKEQMSSPSFSLPHVEAWYKSHKLWSSYIPASPNLVI